MATVTRYFPNTEAPPGLASLDFRDQLIKSITRIVSDCAPKNPWTDPFKNKPVGLWTGPTALAYLFLWLSQTHPDLTVEGRTPIEWCNGYLDCGQSDITGAHDLNGWAVKNEYLAFNTVKACVTKDLAYVAKVEEALRVGYDCPDLDNEHLVGRAGTLSLLRIIIHFVPESAASMKKCMEPLIQHLLASRPWRFHTHNYIGAAHGVIGIITQIILSDPSQVKELEPYLTEMLDLQQEDGHWFITDDPNLGESDLVHYCHGSPGFVMSFMKLRPYVPEEMQKRFDVAIERGRKEVWEKGLLTKEPNLCHGITGNMLAFEDWGQRKHFMAFTTMEAIQEGKNEGKFITGDDPFGLYWGEAGRAWGWMIMDSGIDLGYPTYTDV